MVASSQPNAQPTLSEFSEQCADAIQQIEPSVVAINPDQRCGASGLIWQSNLVVTVDYAVGEDEVTVLLANGRRLAAAVVGRDSSTDLALLKLEPPEGQPEGQPASLAPPSIRISSLPPRLGHLVLGVGRSGEGSLNASLGVINRLGGSWRSRQGGQIDRWIQPAFIAAMGLTGGTLLDAEGKVLGLITTGPRRIALTVPTPTIERVVNQLLQRGRIARGYLGIGMQPVPIPERLAQSLNLTQTSGLLLLSVEPDGPADRAGLLIGDLLISLADQPTSELADLRSILGAEQIGQTIGVSLIRGGARVDVQVTVGER